MQGAESNGGFCIRQRESGWFETERCRIFLFCEVRERNVRRQAFGQGQVPDKQCLRCACVCNPYWLQKEGNRGRACQIIASIPHAETRLFPGRLCRLRAQPGSRKRACIGNWEGEGRGKESPPVLGNERQGLPARASP